MSSLHSIYSAKENIELVRVLESFDQYTEECVEVIKEILNECSLDKEELLALAEKVNREPIDDQFDNFRPGQDEIKLRTSPFLSEEQIKEIYLELMNDHMQRKDGFRFDVWSYALGVG